MKLVCKDLQFSYTDERLIQISHFEISQSAEIYWIRGSSGAGKSTFLSLLAGLQKPHEGQILWNEFDLGKAHEIDRNKFRFEKIGFAHQENKMINHWTVQQNFSLVSGDKTLENICLNAFELKKSILQKPVHELSGGERQRINLIQIILKKPQIALFDEPTSHLDNKNTEIALDLIETQLKPCTVIIISHDNRLEQRKFKQIDFEKINI